MAEERALDPRFAGQVDDPFGVPDPLGPGQRAVRADQAEAPGQLPQGEQGQQDGGFLGDPGGHGQPPRPGVALVVADRVLVRAGLVPRGLIRSGLVRSGLVRSGLVPGRPYGAAHGHRGAGQARRSDRRRPPGQLQVDHVARLHPPPPGPPGQSGQPSVPCVQQTLRLRPLIKGAD
jgi:hypothetical protein